MAEDVFILVSVAPVVSVALLRSIIHRLYNSVVYRLRLYGGIAPDAIGKADSSTHGNI